MTDLRDRVLAAIEDADEPLTVLQVAGALNTTIWQINRCVNTLELSGDIVVDHRSHGVNRVATADDDLVADGGCEQHRVAEETTALEVLEHIPTNTETIPMRQWIAGDRESDEISVDEFVTGLLWSDHAVALGGCLPDEEQGWAYYVDHTGDLRMWVPGTEIRESGEAREELADDLGNNKIRVVAMLTKDQPDPVKAVGKEIVTDGGERVSDPGARVYCPACKSWNSHDDGDCSICGETIAETEAKQTRVGHCKHDATDVYAGRGRGGRDMLSVAEPGQRGWLGNPFTLDDHSRAESIRAFRQAFEDKLQRDDEFRAAVADLAGKTLGCWCQHVSDSEPGCHAEVIAEWADKLAREGDAALDDADRIVTDGGRPPLRRCAKCGLIHRPTEACRAANGGGDR